MAAEERSILRTAHRRASKFQHLTLEHAIAGPSSNSRTALRTPEVERKHLASHHDPKGIAPLPSHFFTQTIELVFI